jgi:hypothetical protein
MRGAQDTAQEKNLLPWLLMATEAPLPGLITATRPPHGRCPMSKHGGAITLLPPGPGAIQQASIVRGLLSCFNSYQVLRNARDE